MQALFFNTGIPMIYRLPWFHSLVWLTLLPDKSKSHNNNSSTHFWPSHVITPLNCQHRYLYSTWAETPQISFLNILIFLDQYQLLFMFDNTVDTWICLWGFSYIWIWEIILKSHMIGKSFRSSAVYKIQVGISNFLFVHNDRADRSWVTGKWLVCLYDVITLLRSTSMS